MIVGRARDIAGSAGAGSHGVNRLVHGLQHRRMLAHAEIVVGAPHRNLARAVCRYMLSHRKEAAAAPQIRENAISTFSKKGLELLLEQYVEMHVDLSRVLPARMKSSHSAFRPSSSAAAKMLSDAAGSSLKTSSAWRDASAATSLSPSTM